DLLGGGGPHVEARHHRTQPAGGGDGLEAGDAGSQDEDVGGTKGAGGGGEHREDPVAPDGCLQGGLVAGERGLGGQDVDRLGPSRARHEFEGEEGGPSGDEGGERIGGSQRV